MKDGLVETSLVQVFCNNGDFISVRGYQKIVSWRKWNSEWFRTYGPEIPTNDCRRSGTKAGARPTVGFLCKEAARSTASIEMCAPADCETRETL